MQVGESGGEEMKRTDKAEEKDFGVIFDNIFQSMNGKCLAVTYVRG